MSPAVQRATPLVRVADLAFVQDGLGSRARHTFFNGYTANVGTGALYQGDDAHPYEIAVMHDGKYVYDTPITSDVCGYLVEAEADEILAQIAALPRRGGAG